MGQQSRTGVEPHVYWNMIPITLPGTPPAAVWNGAPGTTALGVYTCGGCVWVSRRLV